MKFVPTVCLAFDLLQFLCAHSRSAAQLVHSSGALEYMKWFLTISAKDIKSTDTEPSLLMLQVYTLRAWSSCICYGVLRRDNCGVG